jgi:hypothetical protein
MPYYKVSDKGFMDRVATTGGQTSAGRGCDTESDPRGRLEIHRRNSLRSRVLKIILDIINCKLYMLTMTKMLTFIKKEISQYIEPVRQGTAKGDPIGLSSVKYKSTLLFLTNLKGKEIAEAVRASYGIVRVWRTETPYLQAIDRHKENFARNVVRHIFNIVESTKKHGSRGERDYVYFVVGTKINDQLAEDFADIPLYSDDLMVEIYKQAKTAKFENWMFENTFMAYLGFIFALRKGYSLPLSGQVVLDSPVVKERQFGLTFFDFIEALQRPWTPDREKVEQVKISFLKAM